VSGGTGIARGLNPVQTETYNPALTGIPAQIMQYAATDHEQLKVITHEAAECILRRADNRLTAYIEAGVGQHRAVSQLFKSLEQPVEERIGIGMHRLNASRVIDMCYRWNFPNAQDCAC
jgi:hypothetical protein